jgi:hypothetical protein
MLKKFVNSLLVMSVVLLGLGVRDAFSNAWSSASQSYTNTSSWVKCTNSASFGWTSASASCYPGYAYLPGVGTFSASGSGSATATSGPHAKGASGPVRISFTVILGTGGFYVMNPFSYSSTSQSASVSGFPWHSKAATASGSCGGASPSTASVP